MKTTKITIGRLFNLGSYEHIRYEITVEIPSGESATDAIVGLEKILEALKPERQCSVKTKGDLERDSFRLSEMKKELTELGPDPFKRRHCFDGTPTEYLERVEKGYREDIEKRIAYEQRAAHARRLLGELGGASAWKDAKLDWENDDDTND
jgi:hypothetical protein